MIQANDFISKLRLEPDSVLKQMADMHQNDPYLFPMIFQESQARKDKRAQAQAQQMGQQPLTTKEQDLQQIAALDQSQPQMNQPAPPAGNMPQAPNTPSGMPLQGPGSGAQMLPEEQGIGALPANNLQRMAGGGITGYDGGGTTLSSTDVFNNALNMEGVQDPVKRAFLHSLYGQESSSGKNTATSNRGAVGGMQITPIAWQDIPNKDLNHKSDFDQLRGGIRYGLKGFDLANGNPELAGAYYYGGPPGLNAAMQGKSLKDTKNPNAPDTLSYGKQIADRMTKLLPIGSAQAETMPTQATKSNSSDEWSDASPVKAGLPDRTGVGTTGADVGAGILGTVMAPGVHGFAHEFLNSPMFRPGTTLSQALGKVGLASAVPASVLTGGIAASNTAMGNLGYLPAEQRNELANNPMLSAMSGDTGFASAIMDAAAMEMDLVSPFTMHFTGHFVTSFILPSTMT